MLLFQNYVSYKYNFTSKYSKSQAFHRVSSSNSFTVELYNSFGLNESPSALHNRSQSISLTRIYEIRLDSTLKIVVQLFSIENKLNQLINLNLYKEKIYIIIFLIFNKNTLVSTTGDHQLRSLTNVVISD